MTGGRAVHAVIQAAHRAQRRAGLARRVRYGFGVAAVTGSIPLNLVQKSLGNAQLSTIAVYPNAVDTKGKNIARRIWG
jgi:hypothetical protein